MDIADELYLVKLLIKVLFHNKEWKESFNYQIIQQQLIHLLPRKDESIAPGKKLI